MLAVLHYRHGWWHEHLGCEGEAAPARPPHFLLDSCPGAWDGWGGDGSFPDLCGCVPSVGIRTLPSFVLGPRWVWGVCRTVETQPVHSLLAELGVSLEGPEDQMSCGVPPSSQLLGKKKRGWGG